MLRQSEKEWSKQYGLRKTNLVYYSTSGYTRSKRNVYEATKGDRAGELFYINDSTYTRCYREECEVK